MERFERFTGTCLIQMKSSIERESWEMTINLKIFGAEVKTVFSVSLTFVGRMGGTERD